MEVGMSSCEDSDTEEERPNVLDDALKDATGWIDLESTNNIIPQLFIKNIHIKRKVRKDQVTASKPFEQGYRIYDAKKCGLYLFTKQAMTIYLVLLRQQYYHHKGRIRCMKQLS